jgi:foldase protein PrsA
MEFSMLHRYPMKAFSVIAVLGGMLFLFVGGDPKRQAVVAEIGSQKITLEEFWLGYLDYLKNPRVFDSPKLREEFLDELILAKVLAKEAEREGKGNDELLQYKIDAFRDKCLRDQHFERVIKPKIHIEEKDVEEAYSYTQEERRLSHLFFKTKAEADSAFDLLRHGAEFDSLAAHDFTDSVLAHSGGDLGWVDWDQLDYDLAMTAFRLDPPFVSRPVKSPFGYHILRVTDFKKKPLITQQEYLVHRRKAKYLLSWKLGDNYALEYIRDVFSHASIQLNPDVMEIVDKKLENQFKRKPSIADQMSEVHLKEGEVRTVEMNLWDARHEVMATINGKPYTVGDFVGAMAYVPYAAVYNGFRTAFDYAVRDFLLTEEARSMGLDEEERVQMKAGLYRDFLLQLALRRELVRNVTVSEKDLQEYYRAHRKELKGATFKQVHAFLKDFVLTKKKQQAVPDRFRMLTNNVVIKKHMKIINEYYDAVLNYEDR